jgi:hypothetical protein
VDKAPESAPNGAVFGAHFDSVERIDSGGRVAQEGIEVVLRGVASYQRFELAFAEHKLLRSGELLQKRKIP